MLHVYISVLREKKNIRFTEIVHGAKTWNKTVSIFFAQLQITINSRKSFIRKILNNARKCLSLPYSRKSQTQNLSGNFEFLKFQVAVAAANYFKSSRGNPRI